MSAAPSPLFPWLRHVAWLAASEADPFDGPRSTRLLAFAYTFALTSSGTTGRGAWLLPTLDAFPRRSAERYLSVLVGSGLVVLTQPAARRQADRKGRAARYALTIPEPAIEDVRHDRAGEWRTITTDEVADVVRDAEPVVALSPRTTSATVVRGSDPVIRSHPATRSGDLG